MSRSWKLGRARSKCSLGAVRTGRKVSRSGQTNERTASGKQNLRRFLCFCSLLVSLRNHANIAHFLTCLTFPSSLDQLWNPEDSTCIFLPRNNTFHITIRLSSYMSYVINRVMESWMVIHSFQFVGIVRIRCCCHASFGSTPKLRIDLARSGAAGWTIASRWIRAGFLGRAFSTHWGLGYLSAIAQFARKFLGVGKGLEFGWRDTTSIYWVFVGIFASSLWVSWFSAWMCGMPSVHQSNRAAIRRDGWIEAGHITCVAFGISMGHSIHSPKAIGSDDWMQRLWSSFGSFATADCKLQGRCEWNNSASVGFGFGSSLSHALLGQWSWTTLWLRIVWTSTDLSQAHVQGHIDMWI